MRRNAGVTLIELLVAMTLFSLLSVAAFFSLRTGISTLDRTREHVAQSRRQLGAQRAIERIFAGMTPVLAQYERERTEMFFQGQPGQIRFCTMHSLEGGVRGAPTIVELALYQNKLIVNELPYLGPVSAGARIGPVMAGPRSFVLADNLPVGGAFFYLDRGPQENPDLWRREWPHGYLPRAIRVDLGPERKITAAIYVSQLAR
jgi:prepilin-type N-terminal cleavage/methylation domain-containing protein